MTRETAWLRYYRNSLVDAGRMDIRPDKDSVYVESLDRINPDEAKKLLPMQKGEDGKKERAQEGPVQIAPFRLNVTVEHGHRASDKPIYPFWIPAVLTETGELYPPENQREFPWFLREILSPAAEQNSMPALGDIRDYSKALGRFQAGATDWTTFFARAEELFRAVTGTRFREFVLEGYTRFDEYAIVKSEANFATGALIECYDAFLRGHAKVGALAQSFLRAESSPALKPIPKPELVYLNSNHHGQMSDDFPLSDSQRYSMALHLETGDSEILAVNGPPGTGKTTMLRSVVANMIVAKANEGGDPPLLLASSTNNQAITNILDNFARSEETDDPLASNWIAKGWPPGEDAVGTYMASRSKATDYSGPAPIMEVRSNKFVGDYDAMVSSLDLGTATDRFLDRLRSVFPDEAGGVKSLDAAAEFLRKQVQTELTFVITCTTAALELSDKLSGKGNPFRMAESLVTAAEESVAKANEKVQKAEELRAAYVKAEKDVGGKTLANLSRKARLKRFTELRLHLDPFAPAGFFDPLELPDQLPVAIAKHIDRCREEVEAAERELGNIGASIATLHVLENRVNEYIERGRPGAGILKGRLEKAEWYMGLGDALDVTARYRAYLFARRYWEARWLMAARERKTTFNTGQRGRRGFFLEAAHLTPLFVCTCHSIPRFVSYGKRSAGDNWLTIPLADFFDLIIMDEAGQVTPEIGLIPFLHGKRALVVGDIFQIEPIWSITADEVDTANLAECEIVSSPEGYEKIKAAGIVAAGGSAMAVAQCASPYRYPEDMPVRGSLLREHRRCVDEIIEYCNRFVYNDKLLPMSDSLVEYKEKREKKGKPVLSLPALGYVNVRGNARKPPTGSRVNSAEAQAIASFIADRHDEVVAAYDGKKITDLVGVVTPFRAQAYEIKDQLREAGVDPEGEMVVGTVHSLQGAERPIVIFSPTYDMKDSDGQMFFDDGWNMMNVAVSRAKHHFIVIGEMGRLNPSRTDLPSGALGRLLFADEANEISPTFFFERTDRFGAEINEEHRHVSRLDTLQKHVRALERAFARAKQRIVIVSPFISSAAIEHDELSSKIREARAKGVEVQVFTDAYLDVKNGTLKPYADKGRLMLTESGAMLVIKQGIHNKALAIDDDVLVEGSFNWLSAVREEESEYHRREVSIVVMTPETKEFIVDLLEALDATPSVEA